MPKSQLITRRHALWLGLAGLASTGAIASAKGKYQTKQVKTPYYTGDFTVVGNATLKQRAAAKGLIYGAATHYSTLSNDPEFADIFIKECGLLIPEGELKWSGLRPTPNTFDFTNSDKLAKFAQTNGMLFKGHTLVWHQSLPKWFKETINRQNAEQLLTEHIATVINRYAGKIHSWDVVNEIIELAHGRTDGLRKKPWLDLLGPGYIELAFRVAAKADPEALLIYNDYGIEYDYYNENAKRDAILKLLERLLSKGTPIHALGIQSHLRCNNNSFNPKKLRNFLADVASLGLKILISELDVKEEELPLDAIERDRIIAGEYENYLACVLDEKAVISVSTWGLSDRYSWINKDHFRRPLPYDSFFQRKLAWNAVARAFDEAPKR